MESLCITNLGQKISTETEWTMPVSLYDRFLFSPSSFLLFLNRFLHTFLPFIHPYRPSLLLLIIFLPSSFFLNFLSTFHPSLPPLPPFLLDDEWFRFASALPVLTKQSAEELRLGGNRRSKASSGLFYRGRWIRSTKSVSLASLPMGQRDSVTMVYTENIEKLYLYFTFLLRSRDNREGPGRNLLCDVWDELRICIAIPEDLNWSIQNLN